MRQHAAVSTELAELSGAAETAEPGRDPRHQQPGPRALLLRRLALPGRPPGGGPAAHGRGAGGGAGRRPGRRAGRHHPGRRYFLRRQRGRPRAGRGHRPAPEQDHRDRSRGTGGPGRARRGAGGAAAGGGALRAALRARPVDPHPLHHRRHDRQQRLRSAGPGLRQDRRQRRRAGGRDRGGRADRGRRPGRPRPVGRRGTAAVPGGRDSWPPSGPSSAASAARSRATACSICCRRTVSTSRASWPAPRAPSR